MEKAMLFQFEIVTKKKDDSKFLLVLKLVLLIILILQIKRPFDMSFEIKKENSIEQPRTTNDTVFEVHNNPVLETALVALLILGKHKEITIKKTRMT